MWLIQIPLWNTTVGAYLVDVFFVCCNCCNPVLCDVLFICLFVIVQSPFCSFAFQLPLNYWTVAVVLVPIRPFPHAVQAALDHIVVRGVDPATTTAAVVRTVAMIAIAMIAITHVMIAITIVVAVITVDAGA